MENLIDDSLDVLQIIDETLSANDPYNCDFPVDIVRLSDCVFPDQILDPLALLRVVLGDERTDHIEYLDDLELTATILLDCVRRVQGRGGLAIQGENIR
jgi:hypothetical protein